MKINILPGIHDDDNRDYLPEYLKDSEIVVNENGNNSQVYPKRLEEKKGALVDEFVDTWYQYVPESYNPEKKTPIVFSMHLHPILVFFAHCKTPRSALFSDNRIT